MRFLRLAVLLIGLTALPCAGNAQSRVALVVGNSTYQNQTALPNPISDANDMSAALRRLNFDVTTLTNATYDTMRRALIPFSQKANGAEMAVVFFAGHGVEIGGENYLIPIDAQLSSDRNVADETIALKRLTEAVSSSRKLGMVILDACRNNPFLPKMARTSSLTRAVDRGLARVEPSNNILIAYAAREGTTANDGAGRNSPFTAALLKNIEAPGVEIDLLFRRVRGQVMDSTGGVQQPIVYSSLAQEGVYLKPSLNADARPVPELNLKPVPEASPKPPSTASLKPAENIVPNVVSPLPANSHERIDPKTLPELKARMTSSFPRVLEAADDTFAKRVTEASGGRINVQNFAAGEIIPGLQALDAVSNGTVEMAWTVGEYYFGKDPAFKLLTGIPFGFDPLAHVAWRNQPEVAKATASFLAKYNVVATPCGLIGRNVDFASRKEIRAPADLKGLKIRIGGVGGQIFMKLGAVPQQIAGGDIYPALEKRTIDATTWVDPARLEKLGFERLAPNIYYPGAIEQGQIIDLIVSTNFWNSLGPAGQQLIRQECSNNLAAQNATTLESNKLAIERMGRSGARIAPLPKDVQLAVLKAWDNLASETSAKNAVFKALLESAVKRRDQMVSSSIR